MINSSIKESVDGDISVQSSLLFSQTESRNLICTERLEG